MDRPNVDLRELTPDLWPALEERFGRNGACGGCWCMYWRLAAGERYEDVKAPRAKAPFKALVQRGKVHEILASHAGEPVKAGWRGLVARGATIAEGCPVKVGELPAAFAWTGVTSMFEACGFAVAGARPKGKQRYRKVLQTARARRRGDLRD